MGATYGNITLRGPAQAEVVQAVTEAGVTAVVSPTDQGVTVVYDCRGEDDPGVLAAATRWLSHRFACAAWGVYVFDSDVVLYTLCRSGEVLDRYHSMPGYPGTARGAPRGGNAAVLCREMQLKPANVAAVEQILRRARATFEERRHGDLMRELGHPDLAWLTRHSDFWTDEPLPEGYTVEQFRVVGGDDRPGPYAFESEFRLPDDPAPTPSSDPGSEGGGSRAGWIVGALVAVAAWLGYRKRTSLSRRHFVALLAAGAFAAASRNAGISQDA
ncbi:MAG TPA: hypothetical protein VFT45_13550 [Longimicrobium sp.]|nr:hypothetical protein [Longimicrobium sp.]